MAPFVVVVVVVVVVVSVPSCTTMAFVNGILSSVVSLSDAASCDGVYFVEICASTGAGVAALVIVVART